MLKQTPQMNANQTQILLEQLEDHNKNHLIFAVQGGMLSEGIDYKGSLAIGTFIFGPPIPVMDELRQTMQRFYKKMHTDGDAFATIYPAMAKAIQAAGRVIRTEDDQGIIVLFDNRFLQPAYQQCMPQDWFNTNIEECVSKTILKDVESFWQQPELIE